MLSTYIPAIMVVDRWVTITFQVKQSVVKVFVGNFQVGASKSYPVQSNSINPHYMQLGGKYSPSYISHSDVSRNGIFSFLVIWFDNAPGVPGRFPIKKVCRSFNGHYHLETVGLLSN